jgi:hypothetical protein
VHDTDGVPGTGATLPQGVIPDAADIQEAFLHAAAIVLPVEERVSQPNPFYKLTKDLKLKTIKDDLPLEFPEEIEKRWQNQEATPDDKVTFVDRWLVDPSQITDAVAKIEALYRAGLRDLGELVAGISAAVASVEVRTDHAQRRIISAQAGLIAAACAIERLGYSMRVEDDRYIVTLVTLAERPAPTAAVVARLSPLVYESVARPRVVLLTPLSALAVDDVRHAQILKVSELVKEALEPEGFAVDAPGDRLHPDTTHDWNPARMNAAERRRILGCGLVALVSADVPSWGLGTAQAWAEHNIAVVLQFANVPSRVLGPGSSFNTIQEPWESPAQAARVVIDTARNRKAELIEHDRQRIAARQDWLTHLLQGPADVRSVPSRLADARQSSILTNPDEAGTATLTELREMRRANTQQTDMVVDTYLGRASAGAPSVQDLSTADRRRFEEVMAARDAQPAERDLVLRVVTQRHPDLVNHRTALSSEEIGGCLDYLREGRR